MGIFDGAKNFLNSNLDGRSLFGAAVDQINPWDNGASWGNANKPAPGGTGGQDPSKVVGYINGRPYNYAGDFTDGGPQYGNGTSGAILQGLQPQNFTVQAPRTPKIFNWDITGNMNKAKEQGQQQANVRYNATVREATKRFNQLNAQAKKGFELSKKGIDYQEQMALEDNAVNRTRVGEDTTKAIENVNKAEGIYQQDEGQLFDQNYRQVAEQLAAAGAATTGLGKQQTSDMIRLRNVGNQRQLDEFNSQRETKELFKTRTFEDLARGDDRAQTLAANQIEGAKFDLDKALEDTAYDLSNKKFVAELTRTNEAATFSDAAYKSYVDNWLAG